MDQELQLPQMDQAWKLKHDLLWEHTETLTLPSDELTLVFPWVFVVSKAGYLWQ